MERVCSRARVRPQRLDEHRERHEQVWPEMLTALHEAERGNYTLFLAEDGLPIGYLETDVYQAALDRMARTDVKKRWQAEMLLLFSDDRGRAGQARGMRFERIAEVFHLD